MTTTTNSDQYLHLSLIIVYQLLPEILNKTEIEVPRAIIALELKIREIIYNASFNFYQVLISFIEKFMELGMLTHRGSKISEEEKKKLAKNISQYLQTRVMPLLGPLQLELMKYKPNNVESFSAQWLKRQMTNHSKLKNPVLQSDDQPDQIFRQKRRQKLARCKRSRFGIIGDSQKQINLSGGERYLSTPGFEWPKQVTVNLIVNLKKCVFFQHLENKDLLRLIQRMKMVVLQPGETIIREGEFGNQLYIIESGRLVCRKNGSDEVLKFYCKGQIFGELSLLYNNPRASTVTAIEKCSLFALSRADFAVTMQYGMLQKLKQCEELMDKKDIFSSLNLYERSKLYESMQVKNVGPEKYIIREGETGDCFYIVAEGQLVAYKKQNGENKLVYTYTRGGYFGELALLRSVPRQASIKTLTDVRLYYIDAACFSRVLGSFQAILKRSQDKYAKITAQLFGNKKPSE